MEPIYWLLIGTSFLFLTGIIILIIYLYKLSLPNKLRVNIIMKTNKIMRFRTKKSTSGEYIQFNNSTYIFDDECLIKGKRLDDIFYYEGNSLPIKFDFKGNQPKTQAKDYKLLQESTLLKQLFSEDIFETIKMLVIINLVVTGLVLLGVIASIFVTGKAEVVLTPELQEFIVNSVNIAIRGGGVV
jgi:hypothetical protein